tara:strand:- start:216 stop:548 length:333 start_codon:yes stop_codon:yes gene_type:complete
MSKTGIRKGKDFIKNIEKLKKIYGGKIPKNLSIDDADKTLKKVTPIKKNSGGVTEGIKKIKAKSMLTGGQSKIDVNKNNKIDAEDFKLLRQKKMRGGGIAIKGTDFKGVF